MKTVGLTLALIALVAAPVIAGWTTTESTYSYDGTYPYEGIDYSGTFTVDSRIQFLDNGQNNFLKGASSFVFEADDGSLTAVGKSTFSVKGSSNSANTSTGTAQTKVYTEAGMDIVINVNHLTFNANGELTSMQIL